jgi:hypothetical protein
MADPEARRRVHMTFSEGGTWKSCFFRDSRFFWRS